MGKKNHTYQAMYINLTCKVKILKGFVKFVMMEHGIYIDIPEMFPIDENI